MAAYNNTGSRTGRDVESFFDQMGEAGVRLALRSRMRFPMPFGEYHAAMWLVKRGAMRREREQRRRDQSAVAGVALERGSQFASGAAIVAFFALALGALKR